MSHSALRQSVFKIRVDSQNINFREPWKKYALGSSSGTGFYIGDGRIMTNAHVVANATYLSVQRDGDAKPVPAKVEFVAHDCDLALLKVEDESYFDQVRPMVFGRQPRLQSPVATIGFPTGGEQLSITEGVVSRVGYRRYVHHGSEHLLIQVDSAINPGNSGGPVVQGRRVVGVAFQALTSADNTGYIIPTSVVQRFLLDVEDGTYDGHPEDGLTVTPFIMTNPSAARFHGLETGQGVMITGVAHWSPARDVLQSGDILMAVMGQTIGVDGKVSFLGERVDFRTLIDLRQYGDSVDIEYVREGERKSATLKLEKPKPHHKPYKLYAKYPKYYTFGGMVFSTLSRSLLASWGKRWYQSAPLMMRYFNMYSDLDPETQDIEEFVIYTTRLPDTVNAYSTSFGFGVVESVDDQRIRSLRELKEKLENSDQELAVIRFADHLNPLVISRQLAKERQAAIIKKYDVNPPEWFHGAEVDGAITFKASATEASHAPAGSAEPVPAQEGHHE